MLRVDVHQYTYRQLWLMSQGAKMWDRTRLVWQAILVWNMPKAESLDEFIRTGYADFDSSEPTGTMENPAPYDPVTLERLATGN